MCRPILWIALLSLLAHSTSLGQLPQLHESTVPDSVRQMVIDFVESYYDALSDRDWERFAEHFWPGATIVTIWQPVGEASERVFPSTVAQFVERAPEGPGSREIFEERMLSARVSVEKNLATVFTRYRARFGDPGDIMEWEGTDQFALMKFGGKWRIVSLSFAADE